MKDPYEVLEIPRTASDEEVKKAYRKLSRIYHPDANINNPDREQAEEKFKEIQQAYQAIINKDFSACKDSSYGRTGYRDPYGGNPYGGNPYGSPFGGFYGSSFDGTWGSSKAGSRQSNRGMYDDADARYLQAAINYIQNRAYAEALNVLHSVTEHDAYWHYLYGIANWGLRNQAAALEHLQEAVNRDPGNSAYRQTYEQMQNGGSFYRAGGSMYGTPVNNTGGACCRLCIANLVCNLFCPGFFCF